MLVIPRAVLSFSADSPFMKKQVHHRFGVGIVFVFVLVIGLGRFAIAAESKAARVTQAVHDVRVVSSTSAPRAASVGDNVRPGTGVRTGSNSRAELAFTDRTLARLGGNSGFSFGDGEFDLTSGSMLLYAPKNSGGARINTKLAILAGNRFTAMAEYRRGSLLKFILLDGHGSVALKHRPGKTLALHAGQMVMVHPDAMSLPQPQDVDLSKLIKNSLLITAFPPLPNVNLILREAENQQNLPPATPLIDSTGMNARDQRAAAQPSMNPKTIPPHPSRP